MAESLKINEVARLLCTTPDAIRLYEQKGIIQPGRDEENQYRVYEQEDVTLLYDLKMLQNIGFSLSEIAHIVTDATEEEADQMMDACRIALEDKIRRYTHAVEQIKRIGRASSVVEELEGRYFIQTGPHLYLATYSKNGELDRESLSHPFFKYVMDYHHVFRRSLIIPRECAYSDDMRRVGRPGYSIAPSALSEEGLAINIQADEVVQEWKPRRCVYTALRVPDGLTREALQPAYDWMERRNLKLDGDILTWMMKFSFEKGKSYRLYQVWLPIQDED